MNELLAYAKYYHQLGLNVTCISNKVNEYNFNEDNILKHPCHEWKSLFIERQDLSILEAYDWNNAVGLGTLTGGVLKKDTDNDFSSDPYIAIGINGCINYSVVQEMLTLLGLPENYEWVIESGSQCCYYIIVQSSSFPFKEIEDWGKGWGMNPFMETTFFSYPANEKHEHLFEKIFILWKAQVMLPPSMHKSSHNYSFVNCKLPKRPPNYYWELDGYNDPRQDDLYTGTYCHIGQAQLLKAVKEFADCGRDFFDAGSLSFIDDSLDFTHDSHELHDENLIPFFLIVDLETDGLIQKVNNQPTYPNVIQVSWIIMDRNRIIVKNAYELLDVNYDKNSKALSKININTKAIEIIGVHPREVFKELARDLKYCKYIVAHNLEFDLAILENEWKKFGINYDLSDKERICTMKIGTRLFVTENEPTPKYPKLDELYDCLFDAKVTQLHNAISDTQITAKCLRGLIKKGLVIAD